MRGCAAKWALYFSIRNTSSLRLMCLRMYALALRTWASPGRDRGEGERGSEAGGDEGEVLQKSPFELSGGQKRRVAIAGILAMHPEVLILDEPTAGLDPKGRDDILDQIAALHRERKITVILVSHSMEDIAKYVDRIIVMNKGSVMYDDAPKKVFWHYQELEAMGLAAPQAAYVVKRLADKGWDIDTTATTVEEAKQAILKAMGK